MGKVIFRIGLVLVLVGIIFLPLSRAPGRGTPQTITIVEGVPPIETETYLEPGAYFIYIFGFSAHPPDDAKVIVYDQNNLTVFESSVFETKPNGTLRFGYDFAVQKPQNYSVTLYHFNVGYLRLTTTKYVYDPAVPYPYVSLLYIGLAMVIAGVTLIVYDRTLPRGRQRALSKMRKGPKKEKRVISFCHVAV